MSERDGIWNHRRLDCLLNRLFRRRWKNQSSASLSFERRNHGWPMDSPPKGPVTLKMFPFDYVIVGRQVKNLLSSLQKTYWTYSIGENSASHSAVNTVLTDGLSPWSARPFCRQTNEDAGVPFIYGPGNWRIKGKVQSKPFKIIVFDKFIHTSPSMPPLALLKSALQTNTNSANVCWHTADVCGYGFLGHEVKRWRAIAIRAAILPSVTARCFIKAHEKRTFTVKWIAFRYHDARVMPNWPTVKSLI